MECPDRLVMSGALLMIIFFTLLLAEINAIIIIAIMAPLLWVSWLLPVWITERNGESLADCDLIFWTFGVMIGTGIMLPVLYFLEAG